MAFPIKTCVKCGEEFELRPDKPGFANRCLECTNDDAEAPAAAGDKKEKKDATERQTEREANEARRAAIKDMLYSRK